MRTTVQYNQSTNQYRTGDFVINTLQLHTLICRTNRIVTLITNFFLKGEMFNYKTLRSFKMGISVWIGKSNK